MIRAKQVCVYAVKGETALVLVGLCHWFVMFPSLLKVYIDGVKREDRKNR